MTYSQPGIFNVLDHNVLPGDLQTASNNSYFLQQLVYTVQSLGGGTILFPSQYEVDGVNYTAYKFEGTVGIGPPTSPSPASIIIAGTGQGTGSEPTLFVEGNGDLFEIDTGSPEQDQPTPGGNEHIGGITFRDLSIRYDNGTSGTAINVISGENVRVERVVFIDCPQAVWFEDTLQCTMFDCRVQYDEITPSPACVTLGDNVNGVAAKETYIAACTFLSAIGGGTGVIIQGSEHVRMINTQIDSFWEGIKIIPGAPGLSGGHNALRHSFVNVSVYPFTSSEDKIAGTALIIQPQGPQDISQIAFVECEFEPGDTATGSIGPGIYIDEGLYGSTIDNVRFVSCHCTRFPGRASR